VCCVFSGFFGDVNQANQTAKTGWRVDYTQDQEILNVFELTKRFVLFLFFTININLIGRRGIRQEKDRERELERYWLC
jgi:hypothetical protein